MTLLDVEDLTVTFPTPQGPVAVVRNLSFRMDRERLAIVGESGSGKSMTARAVLGLVRPPGIVRASRLVFDGVDLRSQLRGAQAQLRKLRGSRLSMVMQDPRYSLNPVIPVGKQIAEALTAHTRLPRRAVRERVLDMLQQVSIRDPERVARLYPHQLSGGMGQRVMIAMMLAPEPDLLIADEPTSALDVQVQAQVLAILDDLVRSRGMGLILISHDLALVQRWCDRVLVMRNGQIVEECQALRLSEARHPYTRGLLAAMPRLDETRPRLPVLDREPG